MSARRARLFRKALETTLWVVFMACVVWQCWIDFSYDARMPSSPQPNTGRVYRIVVNHGAVRYVTQGEFERADFAFYKLFWIELSLLAGSGALWNRYKGK